MLLPTTFSSSSSSKILLQLHAQDAAAVTTKSSKRGICIALYILISTVMRSGIARVDDGSQAMYRKLMILLSTTEPTLKPIDFHYPHLFLTSNYETYYY